MRRGCHGQTSSRTKARMKKILFVEDNEMLLELYGMLLSDVSDQWQTSLALSGEHAIRLLDKTEFDVVVADMRMRGMDGIELLSKVREQYPQTSRIIISAYTDQAVAADSLNCTHLFIPKPFDVSLLKSTLARISSLDAYLRDEKLRGLAGKMRTLPSFPTLYLDIMKEIESPSSSLQSIAKLVSQDPAITAKMLQVANSAAFGLPGRISDPVEAVQQLGMNTVRSLVLSAQVYSKFAPGRLGSFSADALWKRLMRCGELAQAILRREGANPTETENAFAAGMLHDMGKLMLADGLPDEFENTLHRAAGEKISPLEAEEQVLGATHAGVAAYLFGLWGLPASIVEAVAFHHTPEKSPLKKCTALTAVHVASVLTDDSGEAECNMKYLERVGVADRLNDWREVANELQMAACA